jgi:hypothetical protein
MASHGVPPWFSGPEEDMFQGSYHPHDQRKHPAGMPALHHPLSFLVLPPTIPPTLPSAPPILPRPISYMHEEDSAMPDVLDDVSPAVSFHRIQGTFSTTSNLVFAILPNYICNYSKQRQSDGLAGQFEALEQPGPS